MQHRSQSGELIEVTLPISIFCVSIPGHDCGLQASVHIHNQSPANLQHTSAITACAINFVCHKRKMGSAKNNFFFVEKKSPKKVKNGFLRICW